MNRAGDEFLAGSTFAENQNRDVAAGHLPRGFDDGLHRSAAPDDRFKPALLGDPRFENFVLGFELAALGSAQNLCAEFVEV